MKNTNEKTTYFMYQVNKYYRGKLITFKSIMKELRKFKIVERQQNIDLKEINAVNQFIYCLSNDIKSILS